MNANHAIDPMKKTRAGAGNSTFSAEAIREIYTRPRSGFNFPALVRELKAAGVASYEHVIETGANVFHSKDGAMLTLDKMGPPCPVSDQVDAESLRKIIAQHQQGLSDYPTFCRLAGNIGVARWVCDLSAMTCSYFDKSGNSMHVEAIPEGGYQD